MRKRLQQRGDADALEAVAGTEGIGGELGLLARKAAGCGREYAFYPFFFLLVAVSSFPFLCLFFFFFFFFFF